MAYSDKWNNSRLLLWGFTGLGILLLWQGSYAACRAATTAYPDENSAVTTAPPALGEQLHVPSATQHHPLETVPHALSRVQTSDATLQAATPRAAAQLAQLGTRWLNQFGQAEISLTNSCPNSPLCGARLALLLPWYQQTQQLLFTQWGILHAEGNTTLNVGIGQRHFTAASGYWGYNLFYDYRVKNHLQRLGIGLERRSRSVFLALNGYLPLTAWRLVDDDAHKVRPARGFDIGLQHIPENQPHWRFNLIGERYWGNQVVAVEQQPKRHPITATLGVDYTPVPLVTAGYGFKFGSSGKPSHHLQLNLTYHLGVPLAQQLDPQQVAASRSLPGGRLALVQRSAHITLQQQPNDVIQLILPSKLPDAAPGTVIAFNITMITPRPLGEWAFSWESDLPEGIESQINANRDGAARLTLPLTLMPGTYHLRLVARHTQRDAVARSNEAVVYVQQAVVPPVAPPAVPLKQLAPPLSNSDSESKVKFEDDSSMDMKGSSSSHPGQGSSRRASKSASDSVYQKEPDSEDQKGGLNSKGDAKVEDNSLLSEQGGENEDARLTSLETSVMLTKSQQMGRSHSSERKNNKPGVKNRNFNHLSSGKRGRSVADADTGPINDKMVEQVQQNVVSSLSESGSKSGGDNSHLKQNSDEGSGKRGSGAACQKTLIPENKNDGLDLESVAGAGDSSLSPEQSDLSPKIGDVSTPPAASNSSSEQGGGNEDTEPIFTPVNHEKKVAVATGVKGESREPGSQRESMPLEPKSQAHRPLEVIKQHEANIYAMPDLEPGTTEELLPHENKEISNKLYQARQIIHQARNKPAPLRNRLLDELRQMQDMARKTSDNPSDEEISDINDILRRMRDILAGRDKKS